MKIPPEIKKAVDKLYDLVDVLSDQLKRMDPYWEKCFPCSNYSECCKNIDVPVYTAEWILIMNYLCHLPAEDYQLVQKNIKNYVKCPFRLTFKCAIHPVRPLYCRVTPYMGMYHEANTEIEVMYPTDNCTFVRQYHARVTDRLPLSFERLGGRFFIVVSEVIDKTREIEMLKSQGDPKCLSDFLDNMSW